MSMPSPAAGLLPPPPALERVSRDWAAPLVEAAGRSFRALYLYGSALLPGFDPAVSDVNLLLVSSDLTFDRLEALARAHATTTSGKEALRFSPLVLTESQIRTSVDVFPLEFLDLAE